MRLQDHVVTVTRQAMEEAFRYANAIPADKLEWKPLDKGRSALSLCQELGKCPDWAYEIMTGDSGDDPTNDEMKTWKTVAECEAAGKAKLERYLKLIAEFPDNRISETKELPYGPGGSMKSFTMPELMDYPRWNASYHEGQLAYIQTLYGDADMH